MEYSITPFTPLSALLGGALIGLSSGLMLLIVGRLAGISGIAAGVMTLQASSAAWRLFFIAGLILGALLYQPLTGNPAHVDLQASLAWMFAGGFLVGFGTRMGSGCTAGHGIAGISRLSPRSFVATATFFLTGAVTVYVVRHL